MNTTPKTKIESATPLYTPAWLSAFAAWPGILRVEETERHFFLMIDTNVGHIIPKHAFADAARLDEFREVLAAHVTPAA